MPNRYLPLACFGKLPFWPEFLEGGTLFASSRAFKRWMHRGKERVSMDDSGEARDVAVNAHLRFLTGTQGSTELMAGVVRASGDRGGRHFPFAVFTHLPRKMYGRHYALLPLALSPVWDALDDAWTSLHAAANKEIYEELLGSLNVPRPAEPSGIRPSYEGMQREEATRLFARDDGASPESLEQGFPAAVTRIRKEADGLTVQFPVSPALDEASFDASFWIDLVNRQFRLRRYMPSVFLDGAPDSKDRVVLLKFGELTDSDFPGIMGLGEFEPEPLRPAHGGEPGSTGDGRSYGDLLGRRYR